MSGRLRHEKGAGKPRACHSFVIADRALPQRPPTAALGTRGFVHLDRFGPGCRSRSFRRDLRDFGRLGGFFGCRFRDFRSRFFRHNGFHDRNFRDWNFSDRGRFGNHLGQFRGLGGGDRFGHDRFGDSLNRDLGHNLGIIRLAAARAGAATRLALILGNRGSLGLDDIGKRDLDGLKGRLALVAGFVTRLGAGLIAVLAFGIAVLATATAATAATAGLAAGLALAIGLGARLVGAVVVGR